MTNKWRSTRFKNIADQWHLKIFLPTSCIFMELSWTTTTYPPTYSSPPKPLVFSSTKPASSSTFWKVGMCLSQHKWNSYMQQILGKTYKDWSTKAQYIHIYILSITKHILLYHVQNSAPFRKPREKAERSSNCLSLLSIRHIFSISEENRQVNAKSMPPHNIKAPVLSKEAGATTLASHSNISGTAWQFTLATIDSMSHES